MRFCILQRSKDSLAEPSEFPESPLHSLAQDFASRIGEAMRKIQRIGNQIKSEVYYATYRIVTIRKPLTQGLPPETGLRESAEEKRISSTPSFAWLQWVEDDLPRNGWSGIAAANQAQ